MCATATFMAVTLALGALAVAAEQPAGAAPTTAPSAGTQLLLKYHDAKADGKKSYGGSGEMIEFTMPEGDTMLAGISIHGSRYGMPQAPKEDFTIYVMDEEHTKALYTEKRLTSSSTAVKRSGSPSDSRRRCRLPASSGSPLISRPHQTKGVYVSYDTSTGGEHSLVGIPTVEPQPVDFGGDWMVQAIVRSAR